VVGTSRRYDPAMPTSASRPAGAPQVLPYLYYPDATQALAFLIEVFGFGSRWGAPREPNGLHLDLDRFVERSDLTLRRKLAGHEALSAGEPALVTRERHRVALQQTREALTRALALGKVAGEELIAEELRLAARALGRLTGRVDVEDVLDVIFRDFCIGK